MIDVEWPVPLAAKSANPPLNKQHESADFSPKPASVHFAKVASRRQWGIHSHSPEMPLARRPFASDRVDQVEGQKDRQIENDGDAGPGERVEEGEHFHQHALAALRIGFSSSGAGAPEASASVAPPEALAGAPGPSSSAALDIGG